MSRHHRDDEVSELEIRPLTPNSNDQQDTFLVVPNWWAALIPGGYDYCNVQNAPRFALLVSLVTLIIVAYQNLDSKTLEAGVVWLEEDLVRGGIAFVAVMAVAHVLLIPGLVFSLAAGAIFGVVVGSLLTWLGTTIGQVTAFCMGRYLLRDWVASYMSRTFPKWAAVDSAISKDGWKLITLLRLSPIIPWNVLNYAVSVTGIPLASFALSSALAIIPWSTTLVYFGSLARSMADILNGQALPGGGTSYLLFIVSGLMLVVLVAFATIISRQAIRAALKESSPGGQGIAEELDRMSLIASPHASQSPETPTRQLWSSPLASRSQASNEWFQMGSSRSARDEQKPGHPRAAASFRDSKDVSRQSLESRGSDVLPGVGRGHRNDRTDPLEQL